MKLHDLKEDVKFQTVKAVESDWDAWEQEIIEDMRAGRLADVISAAKEDFANGDTDEL